MPDPIIAAGDFTSQARYLFDRFTGLEGITNLRALVGQTPRVTETNWLEFKTGKVREEDIKPLWSKALGSFANSGGGVVVWGIRADRDPATGIDAVQEEVLVPDVERLTHKLKEWQPPATDPPIRGGIVHPMLLPGSTKEGFVVCLVPESDLKPHRSEFGKSDVKRFHMRFGDSTQECTVPILRQLFYPRYSPKLSVTFKRKDPEQARNTAHISTGMTDRMHLVEVQIVNTGLISVFDLHIRIQFCASSVYKDIPGGILEGFGTEVTNLALHPQLNLSFSILGYEPVGMGFLPSTDWTVDIFARDIEPKRAAVKHSDLLTSRWMMPNVGITVPCVPVRESSQG